MGTKISIIMPAYNSEQFIEESIDSVLKQTLKELELIIINDGSTDSTLDIISKKARTDKRIRFITIENSGSAVARNYGLELATGEFIGFVDSDDLIKKDMFEILYKVASDKKSEIVSCSFEHITSNGDKIPEETKFSEGYYDKEKFVNDFYPTIIGNSELNNYFPNNLWTKIYSKDLLKKNSIKFNPKLKFAQDVVFSTNALLKCNSFYYIPNEKLYIYRYNNKSKTNSYIENCWKQSKVINTCFIQMTEGLDYDFSVQLDYQIIKSVISAIRNEGRNVTRDNYHNRLNNINEIINDKKTLDSLYKISPKYFSISKKIVFHFIKQKKKSLLLLLSAFYNVF
ncbi:glycosyltransferase [Ruoffia sp. FAM 26255]|uniref:glycosyltransferase n=1 Tax=Ruoffia sp. FAM 26255 TaxID=3259519 RepID=UPI0038853331